MTRIVTLSRGGRMFISRMETCGECGTGWKQIFVKSTASRECYECMSCGNNWPMVIE